jgi:hypothetical protein
VPPGDIELSPVVLDPDRSVTFSGPPSRALIREDLLFEVAGLQGPRRLRVMRTPAGFALKAILVNGSDVTDAVLELGRPNQSLHDVEVVLTNRITEIAGTVADSRGRPAANAAVVAFAIDASLRYQGSRFISARTCDRDARFRIEGLPPGDYYVASFDRRQFPDGIEDPDVLDSLVAGATRVMLSEGQRATLALRAR